MSIDLKNINVLIGLNILYWYIINNVFNINGKILVIFVWILINFRNDGIDIFFF